MLYQTKNPHGGDIYKEEVVLDFSANTNPFGTPQAVKDAISDALDTVHRYPDPYCRALTKAISEHENVPREYILCGNGAAELIYAYAKAVKPGKAAELAPTFSEYSLGLEQVGCRVVRYTLQRENDFALERGIFPFLEQEKPEVLYLCNPNNPTGKLADPVLLEQIVAYCAERRIRVFLDECFLDLTADGISMKAQLGKYHNLLILKAFTKSYGMAGVRLGYCMSADTCLLTEMSRASQPWNVSTLAQAAGIAALGEEDFLRKTLKLVGEQRAWLQRELEGCGFYVCPSKANFLLFRAPENLHTQLKNEKIAIRNCDNYFGLGPGWFRIAVRSPEENRALMAAICRAVGKE